MARSIVSIVVAGLSTFVHLGLTIITILGILYELNKRSTPDYSDDSSWPSFSGVMLVLFVIALIVEIVLLLSSIFLIVGIQKERLPYIASWLYLTAAYMVLSFADFVGGYNALGYLFPIKLAVFILHVVMWYPIFKFWRGLGSRVNIKVQGTLANVDSSIYPQLGDVEYARQVPADEHGKHQTYAPLK